MLIFIAVLYLISFVFPFLVLKKKQLIRSCFKWVSYEVGIACLVISNKGLLLREMLHVLQ